MVVTPRVSPRALRFGPGQALDLAPPRRHRAQRPETESCDMTGPSRLSFALAASLAALGLGGGHALAQGAPAGVQPAPIGDFKDWKAYAAPVKGGKVCYALAKPETGRRMPAAPAGAYFFISNRPQDDVQNEVSIMMGVALRPNSELEVEIDRASFTLYVEGEGAFLRSKEKQAELIKAMRTGRRDLTVKAAPARGRAATQTYSLAGVSAAIDKINQECRAATAAAPR